MSSVPSSNHLLRQLSGFKPSSDISPELGDLIEVDQTLYSDWAIYVGDGDVVHIVGEDDQEFLPESGFGYVKVKSLQSLGGDSFVRVNNKEVPAKERSLTPLDPDKVVAKALSMVGSKVEYNMLTRNNEHYLTEWKYGQPWSDQVSGTLLLIFIIIIFFVIIIIFFFKTGSMDCHVNLNDSFNVMNGLTNGLMNGLMDDLMNGLLIG